MPCREFLLCFVILLRFAVKLLLNGINADFFAVFAEAFKANLTVCKCEKSIVLAFAYIGTGVDLSSALPDEDVAGQNELTVRSLGTKTL